MEPVLELPLAVSRCDTCSNENKEGPLLRCSVCKDRFYCSTSCQTQDWKEHKYSCSLLPPDGLEPTQIKSDEEREKVIKDYTALLKAWAEVYRETKTKNTSGGHLRFASSRSTIAKSLITFAFPENLQYKRHPLAHTKYPYRSTLMLAARTGLMQLIPRLSLSERTDLAERIGRAKIPAKWTRIFGPKIVARPENLAPGEYEVFATLATAFLLHGTRDEFNPIAMLPMEYKDFWTMLSEAFKELWDVPRSLIYDEN
ncbi:hypothetical protein AX15_003071 [Amanita polypyramis BW_CC]|nr:hypothetical protein AX15_003071 [Amanita polypyramis BW_CC]